VGRITRETAPDLLARTAVGILFVLLCINVLEDFARTGRVTGLLLLVSEAMVVIFTIVRRHANAVDRSFTAMAVTTLSTLGPYLLRPSSRLALLPDVMTALISSVGLCLVIAGKLTLGRSFGLIPANRGVVESGPYLFVRHPIYTGYLMTHLAFLAANPRPMNIVVVALADSALVMRALLEERVLGRDARYRSYCARVGWHLVPRVF
jgi:protein-S-isoprenylcysteine O-methyltransferase Ste14